MKYLSDRLWASLVWAAVVALVVVTMFAATGCGSETGASDADMHGMHDHSHMDGGPTP